MTKPPPHITDHKNGPAWAKRPPIDTIFMLMLFATPAIAFASDAALIVVPTLNLIATAIVGLMSLSMRVRWRARILAIIAAMAAAGIVWFIPNAWLPTDAWLGPFLMLAAFLPPLLVGGLVIGLSRRRCAEVP